MVKLNMDIEVIISKNKFLVIVILILIVTFGIGKKFIYQPRLKTIEQIQLRIEKQAQKNDLLQDIVALKKGIDSYSERMPPNEEITWVVDEISKLSKDSGIELLSLEPQAVEDKGSYYRLPLELDIECSYHQLGNFLSRIENSPKFMRLDNFKLDTVLYTGSKEKVFYKETSSANANIDLTVSTISLKK